MTPTRRCSVPPLVTDPIAYWTRPAEQPSAAAVEEETTGA
jgi:hypothetical protein